MPVGTEITYSYVVVNTGNQPISNINIIDVHNGSGPAPTPDSETLSADIALSGDCSDTVTNDGIWDVLAPFDEVIFTGTYIVTQDDIDNLQ